VLYGREAEFARIGAVIQSARIGAGGAVAITGEAGVGKTALLNDAASGTDGMRALSTTGLEAESRLPFSALSELADELLDGLAQIPRPQAAALEAALALAPPAEGDRFAAYAGFLALLSGAAGDRPLLVLVDDAHWLDPASAECLAFAARRLSKKPIALLVAAREEEPHAFGGQDVIQIRVPRLERGAARALLNDREPELPSAVAETLLDAAGGNPLALLELPSSLTREQREGVAPLDEPLHPGAGLQRAFARRIGRLPDPARESLLAAATAFTPAMGPIVAACETLGIESGALESAEVAGIVSLSPERIEFSHPLLRGAVYQGATAAERRRAHRALADHADEDARALHLAAAALGPDAEVADALEATAHRAAARGAHATASETLERAARLSEESEARSRRLFAAGLEAVLGAAYDRSGSLLEVAIEIEDPLLRASARHLLALVTINGGVRSALANHRLLTEEADRILPLDSSVAASMYAAAAVTATIAAKFLLVLESAERAQAALPEKADPVVRGQVLSMLGMGLMLRNRIAPAKDALDEAGQLLKEVDPVSPAAQQISLGLGARLGTGQEQILREEAVRLLAAARDTPTPGLLPYFAVLAGDAAYRLGDWDACAAEIAESMEIAEDTGQVGPLSIGLTVAARLWAGRGDEDATRAAVERTISLGEPVGYGSTILRARAALGFLELGLGRVAAAVTQLEEAERLFEGSGAEEPTIVPFAPDLVEAYVRFGRDEDAVRVCARFAERCSRSGTPLALALSARCEGLTSRSTFDEHFERALALQEHVPSRFERARTLLAWGSALHRARRRVEARERLRQARDDFERFGARPWMEHTEAELRAAGAVKRAPVADPDELTAQEVRVALAVARGATNREVAAELFLSPKTIEFHLGRVYRKLGIHSRTELAALVAEGRLEPGLAADAAAARGRVEERAGL
jgi:DNA-binding CsgD family transcriptional regulator